LNPEAGDKPEHHNEPHLKNKISSAHRIVPCKSNKKSCYRNPVVQWSWNPKYFGECQKLDQKDKLGQWVKGVMDTAVVSYNDYLYHIKLSIL
jgi:hypothetical protein